MKRKIGLILTFLFFSAQLFAHSGKPKYHVIIDTDGAADDMRSISMFLAGNDIRTLAITCSHGTLLPKGVFMKVKSLTTAFRHEGIPLGISRATDFKLPPWASFAQNTQWGEEVVQDVESVANSQELLDRVSRNYKRKITLIALGSLKTYADWIRSDTSRIRKIDRIVWYNSHQITKGFNYKASPASFDFIKNSGVPLEIVSIPADGLSVNNNYLDELQKSSSVYAKQIVAVHRQDVVAEKVKQNHLKLWDDLVPLYLTVPILFESKAQGNIRFVAPNKGMDESFIHETIAQLLASSTQTNNRVFVNFPTDTALYKSDYARIVKATSEKFGPIEWKAIAMTNEIHGHTGIYSVIGAKMGVRAMEYYNVGVNNMKVTSFAGEKPPLSCFNDGVQISTGATIGQGLITISDSISMVPSAIFEFNGQRTLISVKKEIAVQMRNEIKFGIKNYGLLTDKYWRYIEELAIKYWSDLDRHEIFSIRTLQ